MLVVFFVFSFVLLLILKVYNGFVALRDNIENNWDQLYFLLKERYNLIPDLIKISSEYIKEKEVFDKLTDLKMKKINSRFEKIRYEYSFYNEFCDFYNKIKLNKKLMNDKEFIYIDEKLEKIKENIIFSYNLYNDSVNEYNISINSFPKLLVAEIFNFKEECYFRYSEEDK